MRFENDSYLEESAENTGLLAQMSFLNKAYGLMTLGLMFTAGVAHYIYMNVPPQKLVPFLMPCIIGELVLVLVLSWAAMRLSAMVAFLGFLFYAFLNGVTMSTIFYAYQLGSVAKCFFITAGTFGAMSLYGVVTQRDLTKMGSFLMMGLIGVVLAGLVNLFFKSTALEFALSIITVLIFVGLTAHDAQKIKRMDEAGLTHNGLAVLAALTIYLDFINLFLYILRLFGRRK